MPVTVEKAPAEVALDPQPDDAAPRDPITLLTRTVVPYALLAGVFVSLVRLAAPPLSNFDTYFHLRFGHEFLTGNWSLRDPGSVNSFATADWVPTQWLPQVVMAQFEEWFGLAGVAWLSGLQFLALAVTVYAVARRHADRLVAAPIVAVTLIACTSGLSMRPQMLSYIFIAITTAAWLDARDSGRTPWYLVPLTWVWTMCHGMWPIGIVIGVVAVVGISLDRSSFGRKGLRLAAVPVLSAAVSLLTPVGTGLFGAVLLVSSRSEYFTEWGTPDFTSKPLLTLFAMIALTAVICVRRGGTWTAILLIGLAVAWAVYSQRTVPVAAVMVAPLCAIQVQRLIGSRSRTTRSERWLVSSGLVVALAALGAITPVTADAPPPQPAWVDSALSDMPEGTKVFNGSAFGGYLMWRYPHLDPVQHGYGDSYTDDELQRNVDITRLEPGWPDLLRGTEAEYALLDPDTALAFALRELAGWTVIHDDADIQMLQPPTDWQSGS